MKVYLVMSTYLFMEAALKYNCENVLISYNSYRCSKDKRSYYDILSGEEKKTELDTKTKSYLKKFKNVMVDSGAFSFMSGTETKIKKEDIDKFVEGYGQWLKDNKGYYDYFEEMDLDFIVGLNVVEEYRKFLEKCAGQKCIPVWHINRGLDYWEQMVKDYDYVAIGGLVTGEITGMEMYAPYLLDIAHNNNCKVHGLGYTKTKLLKYIPWDSVDSSTWIFGGKRGTFFLFNEDKIITLKLGVFNKSSKIDYLKFAEINAQSWSAYAKFIEDYWERQKRNSLEEKEKIW